MIILTTEIIYLPFKEFVMKKERILSYKMSTPMCDTELSAVSAAGMTTSPTGSGSYSPHGGFDGSVDISVDA